MVSVKSVNNNSKGVNFKGILLPQITIRTANDAIQQWEKLADLRYSASATDRFQRVNNKEIQKQNFSFLDKLTSESEQKKFIQHFKEVTGFPNLITVSHKIKEHFVAITDEFERRSANALGTYNNPFRILFRGHNPNSSVGLNKALPGSDLNDSYIVFQGTDDFGKNREIRKAFNEMLDRDTDTRILSYNHKHGRPVIMSFFELWHGMDEMDFYTKQITDDIKPIIGERMGYSLYTPGESLENFHRYNIAVARCMKPVSKIFAKAFPVVIEGIRDGIRTRLDDEYAGPVQLKMNNSSFAWCSNMLQMRVLENNLGMGIDYKAKITERAKLANFEDWSTSKQYKCVTNVIKHMTDDSEIDDEYKKMLTNEDCPIAQSLEAFYNNILNDDLFKQGTLKYFGD